MALPELVMFIASTIIIHTTSLLPWRRGKITISLQNHFSYTHTSCEMEIRRNHDWCKYKWNEKFSHQNLEREERCQWLLKRKVEMTFNAHNKCTNYILSLLFSLLVMYLHNGICSFGGKISVLRSNDVNVCVPNSSSELH